MWWLVAYVTRQPTQCCSFQRSRRPPEPRVEWLVLRLFAAAGVLALHHQGRRQQRLLIDAAAQVLPRVWSQVPGADGQVLLPVWLPAAQRRVLTWRGADPPPLTRRGARELTNGVTVFLVFFYSFNACLRCYLLKFRLCLQRSIPIPNS